MNSPRSPIISMNLVYIGAPDDMVVCTRLDEHLSPLRKKGLLSTWSSLQVPAGTDLPQEIATRTSQASLVVLLLSPTFFADELCSTLLLQVLARPELQVIPVILRPVHWESTPVARLPLFPANGKAITLWRNRDAAFLEIAQEISRRIPGGPPASRGTGMQGTTYQKSRSSRDPLERERQGLLQNLRRQYTNRLTQALKDTFLLPVTFQTLPAALNDASQPIFRHLPQEPELLPAGTTLLNVYDQAGGELLILGEPGAGKTTLLFDLAQALLTRAERDEQQLFPLVFNLASWTQQRPLLSDWLDEQLYRYEVPHKLRQRLIDEGQALLLLDGIDEVPLVARPACIDAIHAYQQKYLVPLVVCSRKTEYFEQSRRLMLQTAVVLQPLTPIQITTILSQTGTQLSTLQARLESNKALLELASSPFLLNVMMVIYKGAPAHAFPEGDDQSTLQQQIFAKYLHRTLSSSEMGQQVPTYDLLSHLIWLARQMKNHNQTELYLEQLPASWLNGKRWQEFYTFLTTRLSGAIIGILVCVAVNNVLFQAVPTIDILFLGAGLGGILSGGYQTSDAMEKGPLSLGRSLAWFGIGFCTGLLAELLNKWGTHINPLLAVAYGLIFAIPFWFWYILRTKVIQTSKPASFNRRYPLGRAIQAALSIGLPIAVSYGLAFGWSHGLVFGWSHGVQYGVLIGADALLIFLPVGGVLSMLFQGPFIRGQLADRLSWSWKRLGRSLISRESLLHVIFLTGLLAMGIGLALGIVNGIPYWPYGSPLALVATLLFGLSALLIFGLSTMLSIVVMYWFLFGFLQGMASETIPNRERMIPNEGIHHSIINGLIFGVISLSVAGLIGFSLGTLQNSVFSLLAANALLHFLSYWFADGFPFILGKTTMISAWQLSWSLGLSIGALAFLFNGGLACWQHYTLRFLLWGTATMPWDEGRMLQEGSRHILLYRKGGSYSFIHTLFRNYLANLPMAFLVACVCGYVSDRPTTSFCPHCGRPLE